MELIAWLVGGYVLAGALAFVLQRPMMYPAPGVSVKPRASGATLLRVPYPGAEAMSLPVYALHWPAPSGAPTVVHFHGNAEQLADQATLGSELHNRGLGVYAVEYPGYGLAKKGSTTEASCYHAAETALGYLHDKLDVPPELTILQGQSLGTGVAVEMALRGHGARVTLIAPYTSIVDMAKRVFPFFPVRILAKDRYDNAAKAPQLKLPVLVVHGSQDEVIPASMGRRLADLLPLATLHVVDGGHHNDLFATGGDQLLDLIAEFSRSEGN